MMYINGQAVAPSFYVEQEAQPFIAARPICSSQYSNSYRADFAFDSNPNTRWAAEGGSGQGHIGLCIITKAVKFAKVVCVKSEYKWEHLTVKCSDDGSNWTQASAYIESPVYDANNETEIEVYANAGEHQWWAVFSDNSETVAEIKFYEG